MRKSTSATSEPMKYSELSAILEELGFERRVVRGSHVLFTHQASETAIMLPIARATETVRTANVVSTRFMLDAKGLADQRKWRQLVERHAERSTA